MYKVFLLYLLILPITSALSQPRDSVSRSFLLNNEFEKSNLLGHISIFSTTDSSISIQNILSTPHNFKPIESEILSLGMDSRYHWVHYRLINSTQFPKDLVSYLHTNELTDLCFYIIDNQDKIVYQQESINDKTLINKKPIPNLFFAFPISIHPNQELSIYMRIFRDRGNVVLPVKLFSKDQFFFFSSKYGFFSYLNYGVLGFAFLLSTILYFFTRHKILYYYGGYCFFYLLICASNEGILKQYVQVDIPFFNDNARIIISGLLLFFIFQFSILFLQIDKKYYKRLYQCSKLLSYFSLLLSLSVLFIPIGSITTTIFGLFIIISLSFVFFLIIYKMIKRQREAFIYFIAVSPFFFSCILYALQILLNVHLTWFYYEMILYQTLIEFVILGLELGYQLVNDRDNSLQRLNQLQWEFTTSILAAQDSERERIASDLHDDLGGTIATIRRRVSDIKLQLSNPTAIKELNELEPLIKKSSDDLRRISHNLMPPEFARIGLLNSLVQLVNSVPKKTIQFEFLTAGTEKKLSTDVELNAYRIVSELIQNILKHSKATQASIQLIYFQDELRILVEDNGLGDSSQKSTIGMGIKNCNLRANYIGAKLSREVTKAGTFVVLDIPYISPAHEPTASDQASIN